MKSTHKTRYAIALAVLAVSTLGALSAYADNAYDSARAEGWFWYQDPPAAKKPLSPPLPLPKPQPEAATTATTLAGPEPFSAAWVRQKLPLLLDRATTNPSRENVRAYKYMERLALDMSTNFADMSEKVVQSDPMLDESVRFPISAMARQQALWQVDQARNGIIRDMSQKAGLWLFFDSGCRFCHSQYEVMQMLAQKHNIEVRYISTDGGVIKGMNPKDVRQDPGGARARSLGIKLTPAVVLVAPPDKLAIVAHGAMALSELEQKMVTAAIDMNIADPELSDIARLQDRGILSHDDMTRIRAQMRDPENPEELVQMLNQMIRQKM